MKKLFSNEIIKNVDIKRYNFIAKAILLIIEKENLNYKFKWIEYNTFKNILNYQ